MSDETETTTSTPEAPESAPEAPEAPSPTDAATTTDDAEALRSDAVKWRRQLRATEAKRDAAHARIDEYDRAEVDRIARSLFQDPRDPWTVLEVSELRDEESGRLDVGKAREALDRVLEERPHWRKAGTPNPNLHAGARTLVDEGPSFGEPAPRRADSGR